MRMWLGAETRRLLEREMGRGGYASVDEVVRAGLACLEQGRRVEGEVERRVVEELVAVAEEEIRGRARGKGRGRRMAKPETRMTNQWPND